MSLIRILPAVFVCAALSASALSTPASASGSKPTTSQAKTLKYDPSKGLGTVEPVGKSAYPCATKEEKRGLDSRALQTELMVGALSCKNHTKYNALTQKFKPNMKSSSSAMKGYFSRNYGGKGTREMDQFVTKLANEAATRSKHLKPGQHCSGVEELFDRTLDMSPNQFEQFASDPRFANATGVKVCQ